MAKRPAHGTDILHEWPLPAAATLGSAVRIRGIVLEIRSKLPGPLRRLVEPGPGAVLLYAPDDGDGGKVLSRVEPAVARVIAALDEVPIIPREAEDILGIKPSERLRWLKDGRLPSAGTRTVRLRGRAKAVTFHVFEARSIEDILDRDLPTLWREEDRVAAAENRKRGAAKAAQRRRDGRRPVAGAAAGSGPAGPDAQDMSGWDDFDAEGFLR